MQAAMYKCLFGDEESKKKGVEALPGTLAPLLKGLEGMHTRKGTEGPYFFSQAGQLKLCCACKICGATGRGPLAR